MAGTCECGNESSGTIKCGVRTVQDRNSWRTLVNGAMNLWVPQNGGELLDRLRTD